MSFALMSTPEATIPNTTKKSRWIATDAPAIFEVQRWDARILNFNPATKVLVLDGSAPLVTLQVGEPVLLVQCSNLVPPFEWVEPFLTTVVADGLGANVYRLAASPDSAMHTHIVAPLQRIGYYFQATINFLDAVRGKNSPLVVTAFPSPLGRAQIQINPYLADFVSDIKATNERYDLAETEQSGAVSVLCREVYQGSPTTDSDFGGWYFAKAVRSQSEGGNLAEFVPNAEAPCKFFNQFDEPTMVAGGEFDVNFLPPDPDARDTQITEKHYNSSGDMISQRVAPVYAGNYVLSHRIDPLTVESDCAYIEVILEGEYTPIQTRWVITRPLFSDANPLTLDKAVGSHTVNFTGKYYSGGIDQLPTNILYPQSEEGVDVNLTVFKSSLTSYTDIYDWHFTYNNSYPAKAGAIQLIALSARGFISFENTVIEQSDIDGGISTVMAKFKSLMQVMASDMNGQAAGEAVTVTQNGPEIIVTATGGYPICFGIFSTTNRFWAMSVNRLSNPDWIVHDPYEFQKRVLTFYPDGKMLAPDYDDLGVSITVNPTYSGTYTTTL